MRRQAPPRHLPRRDAPPLRCACSRCSARSAAPPRAPLPCPQGPARLHDPARLRARRAARLPTCSQLTLASARAWIASTLGSTLGSTPRDTRITSECSAWPGSALPPAATAPSTRHHGRSKGAGDYFLCGLYSTPVYIALHGLNRTGFVVVVVIAVLSRADSANSSPPVKQAVRSQGG